MSKADKIENHAIVSRQDIIDNNWSFRENKEVQSVEFQGLTDSIHYQAFYKCTNLVQVAMPYTVSIIGMGAFQGCKKLASVQLPSGLEVIDEDAFRACEKLQSVTIPLTVKKIGNSAFRTCKELKTVRITKATKKIGKNAFAGCPNLVIYTESGSAAEKYALEADIPVQILSAEELKAAIQAECMPEGDMLEGKLEIAKRSEPAVIAERDGKRILVINHIMYEKPNNIWIDEWGEAWEEESEDDERVPLPEFPESCTDSNKRNDKYVFFSRADTVENILSLKKKGVEFANAFFRWGSDTVKEIAIYDEDSARKAFSDFRLLCLKLKEDAFLRSVATFVPCKKNGSLTVNRKTCLASIPVFVHNARCDNERNPYHNNEPAIDRRYDYSYDLMAKNVSEDAIIIYIDIASAYIGFDEDHFSTETRIADPEIAKSIMLPIDK